MGKGKKEKSKSIDFEAVKERKNLAYQNVFYSSQRIDLMTISISGAGIYVTLEGIKYAYENNLNSACLKASGILFVIAIMVNFASQLTGKKSNELDHNMSENQLIGDLNRANLLDSKAENWSKWTTGLTIAGIALMFLGLVAISVFFLSFF